MVCFYHHNKNKHQNLTISDMIVTLQTPSFNLNKKPAQKILTFSKEELQEHLSLGAVIKRKKQYVPKVGIHGSSTLRADRDPSGAEANWTQVTRFLRLLQP